MTTAFAAWRGTRSGLAVALVTLWAAPAAIGAQDIGPALDPGIMVGWAGGDAVRQGFEQRSATRAAPGVDVRSLMPNLGSQPVGAVSDKQAAALDYRPSTAQRKANFARFVERSRAADPQAAAALENLFATNDVMAMADGWMKPYGMTATNVADASAVYLATAWLATRGSAQDPDPSVMRGLRAQLVSAMTATEDFRSATNAQKQELAEAMVVQALLVSQFVEAAKARPELMAPVQQAVARGARNAFGFDLQNMELTEQGLR